MAKKKKHKKSGKRLNPHKLGEGQLVDGIRHHLNLGRVDQAFTLVKVLLDKHSSAENRDLFKSVLNGKISRMAENGQGNEIAVMIAEAKKRFDADLFSEAEEFNRVRTLSGDQLVGYYSDKKEIPGSAQIRIADHLFFSARKEKAFIKNHTEFKDLFYVREAFKNGFDPETTKKMLSGISSKSPFKLWLLLRKAIEAFYENDYPMLEVLSKKTREPSFPKFLIGKLLDCLIYLEGKAGGIGQLSKTDIEMYKTLCGEGFFRTCVFNRVRHLFGQGKFDDMFQLLVASRNLLETEESNHLFILFFSRMIKHYLNARGIQNRKKSRNLPEIEEFFLNQGHMYLKLLTLESLPPYERQEIIERIIKSSALAACTLFKPEILKAELLFKLAKSTEDCRMPENPFSFLTDRFLDGNDDFYEMSPLLEESLELSHHNPEIFISLINEYIDLKEKTSTINRVVKKLLEKFPENPDGYKLAGDIAYRNKTYSKALGFYEKAYHLMPLNREFPLTVLRCYDKIIEKRKRANVHLIEKDLEKANVFVNPANRKAVINYNLLQTKAFFKITEHDPATIDRHYPAIAALSEQFMDSPQELFRYLSVFDGSPLGGDFTNRYLSGVIDRQIQMLDTKEFSTFLSNYLDHENRQNGSGFLFYQLLLAFFEKEKQNPSASFNDISSWLLLCLEKGWHALFISLIYYGKFAVPQHPVINFFLEITRNRINVALVRKWLLDEGTIEWFRSKLGLKILDYLYDHHYLFEDLLEIFDIKEPVNLAYEIKDLLDDDPSVPFSRFRDWFLEMKNRDDKTPLESVENIFGSANDLTDSSIETADLWKKKKKQNPTPEKPVDDAVEEGKQLSIFDLLEIQGEQ